MANVSSNNLTTLYSGGGVNVRPTSAYGNANVVSLLNVGTDGGNTVTNIVGTGNITIENITANGNITADYYFGNGAFLTGLGNLVVATANFANYAGNVTVSAQPNITSVGTLTGLSSNGTVNFANASNVNLGSNSNIHISGGAANFALITDGSGNLSWGQVANAIFANTANFANYAGNVTVSAQPNITSVGTLTGLTSNGTINFANAGNINLGTESNIHISGGAANYALITDGSGNLSWGQVANAITANFANYAGNVTVNAQPNITSLGTLVNVSVTGNITSVSGVFIGNGSGLTNINGANVNTVANANFAAFAGNVTNSAQPNITSVGTLTSLSVTGNITSGNANLGNLVIANFFSGDGSLLSNINGANITGNVANANYAAFAGNVVNNAQPNITSVGTLISLDVTGNITSGNANLGNLVVANFFSGDGGLLSNINGANITGNVANANYAAFAGNVVNNAQPNITSLGNLPYLQVSNSANADGVINQFGSNNITFATNSTNIGTYHLTTQYHPNASTGYPGHRIIRSRGNATTPTTAVSLDRVFQRTGLVFNGTVNPLVISEIVTATGGINANANAVWSGGQWQMSSGNPIGDVGNSNASSGLNALIFTNSGALQLIPGTPANTSLGMVSSSLLIDNYGASTANLVQVGGLNMRRARGNRDSVQPVQAGDQVGRSVFIAYSNGAYQSSNVSQYRVIVDSTYVANDLIVPMSHQFQTVANVANVSTFRTWTFYSNSTTALPGNINFTTSTANLFTANTGQIALGIGAGITSQSANTVAIGRSAGGNTQGAESVAIGYFAGEVTQGANSISIGRLAGGNVQGVGGVAIGRAAGFDTQGSNSVAIGTTSGETLQGNDSVAIGRSAGRTNQANNTIILNATGSNLEQTTANTFTVKPVRNIVTGNVVFYNNTSGEISYDTLANYTGNIGVGNITVTGTANIANLQLNYFQETVYNGGNATGTITPDFNNGSIQKFTLTGNITMNTLGNAIAGRSMTLIFTQDGTGNRLLTSSMYFAGGITTLSSSAGARDVISVFYDGTDYYASLTTGYA
jgi:hypothetical protein